MSDRAWEPVLWKKERNKDAHRFGVRRYMLIIREVDRELKIPDGRKKLRLRQV